MKVQPTLSAFVHPVLPMGLLIITAALGCDAGSNESRRCPSAAPSSTSSAPKPTSSLNAPSSTAGASADPKLSPGWAKQLPDGFVYFDDALTKHGRAPLVAVIVPAARGGDFYFAPQGSNVRYWTPTIDHVFRLNAALLKVSEQEPRIAKMMIEYRYHVVGIDDGKRRIFVSAFCRHHDQPSDRTPACTDQWKLDLDAGQWTSWPPDDCRQHDWLRKPVRVRDGGACYFNFEVDPETGGISALEVNGEA